MALSIAVDFFRSAFDGSGADNFFDAGSCIDGRLTSAWNCKNDSLEGISTILCFIHYLYIYMNILGCSQIEKKSYFPVFLLTVSFPRAPYPRPCMSQYFSNKRQLGICWLRWWRLELKLVIRGAFCAWPIMANSVKVLQSYGFSDLPTVSDIIK